MTHEPTKGKTNARGQSIAYTYSIRTGSVLTERIDGKESYRHTYDDLGKLTKTDVFLGEVTDTTDYTYDAHDRLATVSGPWLNSKVAFAYDGFGRTTRRTVNNVAHSFAYDALSRLTSETNALGKHTYTYETPTNGRVVQVAYPNKLNMKLSYHPANQGKRLREIRYENGAAKNTLIASHAYEYSKGGNITKWTQQHATDPAKILAFEYDKINQLSSALETQDNSTVNDYAYLYDLAGNRTQEQINGVNKRSIYDRLNQLVTYNATGEGGKMRFTGTTTDEAWVTVNGVAAKKLISHSSLVTGHYFEAWVEMLQGENNVEIVAMTADKVSYTESYKVNVPATEPRTYTYDLDGNPTSVGASVPGSLDTLYEWDAHNRLAKISHADGRTTTEFFYDALGRRTRIVETHSSFRRGTVLPPLESGFYPAPPIETVTERRFLWVPGSNHPIEERNARNETTRRYFSQGEQAVGAKSPNDKLFYTLDHLGSVRELINNNFTSQTVYDYDPYGRRTKVSGSLDTVVGYTGHHWHEKSGLYLTWYRQYDPNLGRWLNRDPIGEQGGLNLYGYVGNNAINIVDALGLFGCGTRYGPDRTSYLGHSDMGSRTFDYTAEDYGSSGPFRSPENHFQDPNTSYDQVGAAIEICNIDAFQRAMHRLQDYHSHYAKNYRWGPGGLNLFRPSMGFGHLFAFKNPDNDPVAWHKANETTEAMEKKWFDNCKSCNGTWVRKRNF